MINDQHEVTNNPFRATGRTTRDIDHCIQELFKQKHTNDYVRIEDHYEFGTNTKANQLLVDKIMRRLSFEHPHIKADRTIRNGRFYMKLYENN